MAARALTQSRIDSLKPRGTVRNLCDGVLKGFGIRILPSGGKRYFVHAQRDGRRIWKMVGDAESMRLDEARRRARALLAATRLDGAASALPEQMRFEAVAEEVFRHYARNWKPRTLHVNRHYLRRQLLPWFQGRNVADITRADVQRWFASLHATPTAADRSAPILSVILRQAELYGYRPEGSNPCVGIRRYRRKGRERFLSEQELRRLAQALGRHETHRPLPVAFVRLLLLTGCRKGELATLAWSSYREGHLFLPVLQGGAAHGVAVLARAGGARRTPAHEPLGLPLRERRGPAAFDAQARSPALGVLPAATLTVGPAPGFGIANRLPLGPEPFGAGGLGGTRFLATGHADAALGRGRALAALDAQAALPAFGSAPGCAAAAWRSRVRTCRPPSCRSGIGRRTPAGAGPAGRPGRGPSALLLAVAEEARRKAPPRLPAASGARAGADEEFRTVGLHRLGLLA